MRAQILAGAARPGREPQQNESGGDAQHAGGAGLLADHPQQPDRRPIHRKREALPQQLHPPPRPGRNRARPGTALSARYGEARPSPMTRNTSTVTGGGAARPAAIATAMNGAVQGVATSTASAPVKKLPQCPSRPARPPPMPATPPPICEHAGQVQPDREQQPRHRGDEDRRGELKSPSRRRAGRAGDQQRERDAGERGHHPAGVSDRMCARPAARQAGARIRPPSSPGSGTHTASDSGSGRPERRIAAPGRSNSPRAALAPIRRSARCRPAVRRDRAPTERRADPDRA